MGVGVPTCFSLVVQFPVWSTYTIWWLYLTLRGCTYPMICPSRPFPLDSDVGDHQNTFPSLVWWALKTIIFRWAHLSTLTAWCTSAQKCSKKLCGRPPQYASAPYKLTLRDVGYLCASFGLPRPLCSRLRPDVHDRQMSDRQTSDAQHRLMPPPYGSRA